MTFQEDIITKIKTDFGEKSGEATDVLKKAIEKTGYLKTNRIVRCIIFLSKGDLNELRKLIAAAILDSRDVMLWAEYEQLPGDMNYKRLRDLNKTFADCENNVKE